MEDKEPKNFEDNIRTAKNIPIQVGKVYNVVGTVTKILHEEVNNFIFQIDGNIEAIADFDSNQITLFKNRIFEQGIFVSEILTTSPKIRVRCQSVIFGKQEVPTV